MSPQPRLRTLMVCLMLEFGALTGITMRPEQIQELMHTMNQPKTAHTIPDEREKGDDRDDDPDL